MLYVRKLFRVLLALALAAAPLAPASVHAADSCAVCIVEVQMHGPQGQEDQDMVVLANVSGSNATASTTYPILLTYSTDDGRAVQSVAITKTIVPGQVLSFVSAGELAAHNPVANTLPFGIFSGGGSLRLSRTTSTGTTVFDAVGWGSASKGSEEQPYGAGQDVGHIIRKRLFGAVVDTGNNVDDFEAYVPACAGVYVTEVQPFAADPDGRAVDSWVEVWRERDDSSCHILTASGSRYYLPADMLPPPGELGTIMQAYDESGIMAPLNLDGSSGEVMMFDQSAYGDVVLPIASSGVYQGLVYGQTWALVGDRWAPTYQPTLGQDNILRTSPQTAQTSACQGLRITELLPNPAGNDDGNEWIELHNESDTEASLAGCSLTIAGESYAFAADIPLDAGEWRVITALRTETDVTQLTLKNSGETVIELCAQTESGAYETVQSFMYADAPDGQSYARFADGWRWVASVTPGAENKIAPDVVSLTEHAADAPGAQQSTPVEAGALLITELLPNPAAPATDESDEFIELWNTSDEAIPLAGMKLQTGNIYSYSFGLTDQIVQPYSYLVIKSSESKLTLSNTSGRARLIASDGSVITEAEPYISVIEGQSWALIDGAWKWTAVPTPGMANVYAPPTNVVKVSATTKKASTGATTKPKTASGATSVTKAAKTTKSTTGTAAKTAGAATPSVSPLHPAILAGVGALAVLYAGYEYRQDIALKVYQFRRNRAARRSARSDAQRR